MTLATASSLNFFLFNFYCFAAACNLASDTTQLLNDENKTQNSTVPSKPRTNRNSLVTKFVDDVVILNAHNVSLSLSAASRSCSSASESESEAEAPLASQPSVLSLPTDAPSANANSHSELVN